MRIPPVTPVDRAAFFPRPKDSRHFSQHTNTNRRHKMSNNTNNTQESSEDNTANIPIDIDYGSIPLNRRFWTTLTIGGYVTALIILASIALSS
jgi:hypothetical protein